MDLELPSLVSYVGSWFAFIGGLWTLFDRAETVASPKAKSKVTEWLNRNEAPTPSKWAIFILESFDNVFGKKHFSVRCFLCSSIASIIIVACLVLLFLAIRPEQGKVLFELGAYALPLLFTSAAMLNFVPDYFSLLQTRFILYKIDNSQTKKAVVSWFLLDFFATTLISVATISFFYSLSGVGKLSELVMLFRYGVILQLGGDGVQPVVPLGVFFYSTFLTSIWIWLFLLSSVIAKASIIANNKWIKFRGFFDFEKKPIKSIGFISMLMVSVIYLTAAPFWIIL